MINERVWKPEDAVYRAVTGQTSNFPDSDGTFTSGAFPTKGTIPKAVAKTGTITSTGTNVLGSSTLFETEAKIGDFIYDPDAAVSAVRRITKILSNTMLEIASAFPVDIDAGSPFQVCEKQYFQMVYAKSTGSADAELQETTFRVNDTSLTGGAPLAYDASASNAEISFECHR